MTRLNYTQQRSSKAQRPNGWKEAVFLACASFTVPAYADGWTSIDGKNSRGDVITWEFENILRAGSPGDHEEKVASSITVSHHGSKPVVYTSQPCSFSDNFNVFSCAKEGASPLAGAVYLRSIEPGECGGYIFTVKKGSGGPGAPQRMHQAPWEC